jgi:hypothetical protein
MRSTERLTVDRYLTMTADDPLSIDTLLKQKPRVLEINDEVQWLYETSDIVHLLKRVVGPRMALVTDVYANPEGTLATVDRAAAFAARTDAEYTRVRAHLLAPGQQHRGHADMTAAQRTALYHFFIAALVAVYGRLLVGARARHRACELESEATDLPYVSAVYAATGDRLTTADKYRSYGIYTLDELQQSLAALTRTLNLHGDQLGGGGSGGAATLDVTWATMWSRMAMILMDDLTAGERADPDFYPTFGGLGSLFTDPVADTTTEWERRRHYPLPLVAGNQRLRTYFLARADIWYGTHAPRLAALRRFTAAASVTTSVSGAFAVRVPNATCSAAFVALLQHVKATRHPLLMRLLNDRVYSDALGRSWIWCEEEEEMAAWTAENASRDRLVQAAGQIAPKAPEDAVRTFRPADFKVLADLADDATLIDSIIDEFLVGQEGTEAGRPASRMERMAVVFITRLIDGLMVGTVPTGFTVGDSLFLDEATHFGADAARHRLVVDADDAFRRYGRTSGCALVRLMRRTFVVFSRPLPARGLVTVEVPSFLLGLCVWLARLPKTIPADSIPSQLRSVVAALH